MFPTSGGIIRIYKFCLQDQGNETRTIYRDCLLGETKMIRGFREL